MTVLVRYGFISSASLAAARLSSHIHAILGLRRSARPLRRWSTTLLPPASGRAIRDLQGGEAIGATPPAAAQLAGASRAAPRAASGRRRRPPARCPPRRARGPQRLGP